MYSKLRDAFEGTTDGILYGKTAPADNHPAPPIADKARPFLRSLTTMHPSQPVNYMDKREYKSKKLLLDNCDREIIHISDGRFGSRRAETY